MGISFFMCETRSAGSSCIKRTAAVRASSSLPASALLAAKTRRAIGLFCSSWSDLSAQVEASLYRPAKKWP